jgi:hypothetical protein
VLSAIVADGPSTCDREQRNKTVLLNRGGLMENSLDLTMSLSHIGRPIVALAMGV